MAAIEWDKTGERIVEAGVDHGVYYDLTNEGTYTNGVAWNGLTGVNENPEGGEPNDLWADNIKYCSLMGTETFGFSITAYTYPTEFEKSDGSIQIAPGVYAGQQNRAPFGFCYRSLIGNDTEDLNHGYTLHLCYGCKASPSGKDRSTVNDSPDAIEFSWDVDTTPVQITTKINDKVLKPTSHLVIRSTDVTDGKLKALEDILYGGESATPRMPLPDEVITLLGA